MFSRPQIPYAVAMLSAAAFVIIVVNLDHTFLIGLLAGVVGSFTLAMVAFGLITWQLGKQTDHITQILNGESNVDLDGMLNDMGLGGFAGAFGPQPVAVDDVVLIVDYDLPEINKAASDPR